MSSLRKPLFSFWSSSSSTSTPFSSLALAGLAFSLRCPRTPSGVTSTVPSSPSPLPVSSTTGSTSTTSRRTSCETPRRRQTPPFSVPSATSSTSLTGTTGSKGRGP